MSLVIAKIRRVLNEQESAIDDWLHDRMDGIHVPLYSSVDIRYSGAKMVPVDNNLFPAGFNLLSEAAAARAAQALACYLHIHQPGARKVVLIPENHTRNTAYLSNVDALYHILEAAGMEIRLGNPSVDEAFEVETSLGHTLKIEPLTRDGDVLKVGDFEPDLVVVNNDLSAGAPDMLRGVQQPVFPPVGMGWYRRRKTDHFESYARVAEEFGKEFDIDPWQISAFFERCGGVDFKAKEGLQSVADAVDRVIAKVQKKYDEYGIDETPYVFIKANNGTYGMGVMTAKSGQDVLDANKNTRKKMQSIKEGETITEVIVQEGIPTLETVDDRPAESLIYLIGGMSVGCLYRINEARDAYGSLNRSGMDFADSDDLGKAVLSEQRHCPIKGLVARLSTLAAAYEIEELMAECDLQSPATASR